MAFQQGVFQQYRSVQKIHIGGMDITLNEDDVVEYDGQTLKASGREAAVPALRSAIEKGFFVLQGQANPVRPRPPRIQSDDEREVGTVAKTASATTSQDGVKMKPSGFSTSRLETVVSADSSEGVVIGRLKTAAVSNVTLTESNRSTVDAMVRKLDSVEGSTPSLVHKVASTQTPTVTVTESDPVPVAADPLQQKIDLIRLSIPHFAWDTSVHWKSRVKTALTKHINDPLYLNAILAVEADSVKKEIAEGIAARQKT